MLVLVLVAVFFTLLGRISVNRPSGITDAALPIFQLEIAGAGLLAFSIGGTIDNLIFFALAAWLLGCAWDRSLRPSRSGMEPAVLAYLGVSALSFLFSPHRALSWETGFRTLVVQVAWFFLIMSFFRDEGRQKAVLATLFFALGLTVAAGLVMYGRGEFFPRTPQRIWLSFGHPNSAGAALVLLIPGALAPLLFKPPPRAKLFSGLAALLLLPAAFLTFSRTAWISLLIGLGILAARHRIKYLGAGILLVALALLLVFNLDKESRPFWFQRVESFADWRTDQNILDRLAFWEQGFQMIRERPLLGHGPGYGLFVAEPDSATPMVSSAAPHNFYISQAVSAGTLGLGVFLWLVFVIFRSARRELTRGDGWFGKSVSFGLIAGLTGFLIGCLADDPLLNERISFLFWLLAGILAARLAERRSPAGRENG